MSSQAPSPSNEKRTWKLSVDTSVFFTNEIASAEFAMIVPLISTPFSSISYGRVVSRPGLSDANGNLIDASWVRISRSEWNHSAVISVDSLGRKPTPTDRPRRSRSSSRSVT